MPFALAGTVVNDALVSLGLGSAMADPYTSTDAAIVQLRQMLVNLCSDLVREHDWQHLQKTWTFSTANGTASYSLPTDFLRVINQTFWNRTNQRPLRGPVGPQAWQALKAQTSSGTVEQIFRIYQDKVWIHPTPTSTQTIAYEYMVHDFAADDIGEIAPTDELPESAGALVFFDSRLLTIGIQLYWKQAKGFDTTSVQADYDAALSRALATDGAAPVLSLGGNAMSTTRMLSGVNVPETGFGS